MTRPGIFAALTLLSGSVLLSACDGGSSDTVQAQLPICAAQTFRLIGTIDGMSVDVNETASGGFSQDNSGGEFDQGQVLGGNATTMKLLWSKGIVDGEVTSATATFTAAAGAFAGQPFCAGAGTQVVIPTDTSKASIQFVLDSLTSGDGCGVAHTGKLQGCMN